MWLNEPLSWMKLKRRQESIVEQYRPTDRPSHLRRAIFGPSNRSVRAIGGPPSCQTANRHCPAFQLHYRTWPAYVMRHGPFLARLVFANEKACLQISVCNNGYQVSWHRSGNTWKNIQYGQSQVNHCSHRHQSYRVGFPDFGTKGSWGPVRALHDA